MASARSASAGASPRPLPLPAGVTLSGAAAAAAAQHHQRQMSGTSVGSAAAAGGFGTSSGTAAAGGKKRERWIVTRKTWRYMADAGKLLIPDALKKGKDMKDYSIQDLNDLDDHYQKICDQQREFVIWEGPLEGRKH